MLHALHLALLAQSVAVGFGIVLPVDKLEANKLSLIKFDTRFQSVKFSLPFPDNPWGANETERLSLDLNVGNYCSQCFDVIWKGTKPVPYPKRFSHPSTHDSSDAIHVAEITISDFPRGTTGGIETADLHFAIISVDDQRLAKPLEFSITWNFQKPWQRLGRLLYEPGPQVIEFTEFERLPEDPQVPPPPSPSPNRTCPLLREIKVLSHDERVQSTTFTLFCEKCFGFPSTAPDSLAFSLQPQPSTTPDAFTFVLNSALHLLRYKSGCPTRDGTCRLHVQAQDAFDVYHDVDILLDHKLRVVKEEYSELGSIGAEEHFTVSFWIFLIDGKRPSEMVTFTVEWDLRSKIDRRIPRWEKLCLEPIPIRFPYPDRERFNIQEGWTTSEKTRTEYLYARYRGENWPSQFHEQGSSLAFKALLILVGFVVGTMTSSRFGRRR